ncbi:hypothetical protein [Urechidicola vernalis]|uniref:Uncharacterized protein n=1 Tax=Urechidicola vernalis TaxID=3075600 RepID=A0ABU2Y271_9FLAO|nr:hypothetical protein [Urechidicola sp. P050]MDT0551906.1 hypothetical protein [Urechidicola sp. P050]
MESNKIEQLLEKYLNAETTIKEETVLSDYFTSDRKIPAHLEGYKALFGYFAENKSERYTKTIQLKTEKTNWKWLSVAASVVLLFSVYTGYNQYQANQANEALAQTQMAFQLLSKNINKGTTAVTYLGEYETTANKIFKQP